MVLSYSLAQNRKVNDSINLIKKAINNFKINPTIFHSDYGIEYANNEFKNFLTSLKIRQSMSPKGNSLANRPSEFFFANIQREKLDFYDFNQVIEVIEEYINWYNNERPQSCLQYKTPESFSLLSGVA